MTAAVLTLLCLVIRYCITTYAIKKQKASGTDVGYFISFLIQAITVVVVSVPEGFINLFLYFEINNFFSNQ
jgi:ABC-type Fe3+ transport system permease subunit